MAVAACRAPAAMPGQYRHLPDGSACGLQVTSTRKGLRNQFKALLGLRKPGSSLSPETVRSTSTNGTYDNSSPEGQLRQLGDLAFMLQDFETAASSYQLLATDLKSDRAWRQYAATQVLLSDTRIGRRHAEIFDSYRCSSRSSLRFRTVCCLTSAVKHN